MKRYLLILALIISNFFVYPQYTEPGIKATLIYYFGDYVTWPNHNNFNSFTIAAITNNNQIITELNIIAKTKSIKNKPIVIKQINTNQIDSTIQILYIDENYNDQLSQIYKQLNNLNILLVTDNATNRLYTMINFIKRENDTKVTYETNKQNITNKGFTYRNELLIYGGSMIDVKELVSESEEKLALLTAQLDTINKKLDQTELSLTNKNTEIQKLQQQIEIYNSNLLLREKELNNLLADINEKQKVLTEKTHQINQQQKQYKHVIADIKSREIELVGAKAQMADVSQKLNNAYRDLEQTQTKINKQTNILKQQSDKIKRQNRQITGFAASIIIFIVLAASIYRLYRIKNDVNKALEKKVEERTALLNQSRLHYQNLFENTPASVWELDLWQAKIFIDSLNAKTEKQLIDSFDQPANFNKFVSLIKVISINNEAVIMFGAESKEQLINYYLKNLLNKNFKPEILETIINLWKNQTRFEYETTRTAVNGNPVNLITRCIAMPNTTNLYSRVLYTMTDITKLKEFETEIKKHRDHLEQLVDERSGEILNLNTELLATNEELRSTNENLEQNKNELEKTLETLKHTQNQLIQSEKLASIGMLTAGIAHEINNPVNFISAGAQGLQSLIENLKQNIGQQNNETKQTIELFSKIVNDIIIGVNRTTNIINSMRRYVYNEKPVLKKANITESIDNALELLYNKYKHNITIAKNYNPIPNIDCYITEIDQIFLNILSNAIDAITGKGTIFITVSANNNYVTATITDTGSGMDEKTKNKLFSPFFTTKNVGKGTGLGLYIVYGYIQHHNATINIESEIDKGTTVKIELPLLQNI